jgi:hypothetical protein
MLTELLHGLEITLFGLTNYYIPLLKLTISWLFYLTIKYRVIMQVQVNQKNFNQGVFRVYKIFESYRGHERRLY